ncbi:XRE family transcriptional regulator [Streptomyces morookaense]|uniref:XRE family transcriptional regulator n=1 Tax=Streptomyces morookaense TaxID=1970 RepID=UPI0033EF7766
MRQELPEPRAIVAALLGDERLQTACRERDMGSLFRLLHHRGVSTRRIAAAVQITQGRLYDYMNGKSRVEKLSIFEQIADAFHIPGAMLGLARRSWEPDTRPLPVNTASTPPPDGDDLATMKAFRDADRQTGGGRLYGAVVRHLNENVARRLFDSGHEPQVFAVGAALTEMAGWMAHDSGHDDLADRHFARALLLARTSGDNSLAANIAASSSHLALQKGDVTQAGHWAQVGIDLAGDGPQYSFLIARLHAMAARAMAASEQHLAASKALDLAQEALMVPAHEAHAWLSPFDTASLASEAALALRDLKRYDAALAHARRAIELRGEGRARSLALSRIAIVNIHAHRGDLDAVVHFGGELLTANNPSLGSVRVVKQLDELRDLLGRHHAYPPVKDLSIRLADSTKTQSLLLADIMQPRTAGCS